MRKHAAARSCVQYATPDTLHSYHNPRAVLNIVPYYRIPTFAMLYAASSTHIELYMLHSSSCCITTAVNLLPIFRTPYPTNRPLHTALLLKLLLLQPAGGGGYGRGGLLAGH